MIRIGTSKNKNMKSNKKLKQAKSVMNTERNRAKARARFTKKNQARRQLDGFSGFVVGAPLVPVLDLLRLGGAERVRVVVNKTHTPKAERQARFTTSVAAALAAAASL